MTTEHEPTTEVEVYKKPATRAVDLRERATDSWTDVLVETAELARYLAPAEGLVPEPLRTPAKIMAAVMQGREVGLPPMAALNSIYIVEGKAGFSAEMLRALVLQAGHELAIKRSDRTVCEMWGRRKGQEEWTKVTWTIQEANQTQVFISKAKGWGPLSQKSQWLSWPAEMLLARATTRLVRMIFPDVAHGMRSAEELRDMVDIEVVDDDAPEQPIEQSTPVQRKRAARPAPKATKPDTPAAAPDEANDDEQEPTEVVERARKTRPAPRPAPEPAPEPEPEPKPVEAVDATVDTLPDAEDIVDAEVIEEDTAPAAAEEKKPTAVPKVIGVIQMHWQRLEVTDRAERLWYTGIIVGREIQSTKDLSQDELRKVVNTLERARDIKAINALVDKGGRS